MADFFSSMRVSASGLDAQMKRMNTISSNIANAETAGYKRKDAEFTATADRESFGDILQNKIDEAVQGVVVTDVREDTKPQRLVYRPEDPHANEEGYVEMPNVNPVMETADMISAQRSYEANVTAIGAATQMANKALELGR
ncbi:flagellar basal body rod protein FlgC [bacterium]|jgi:flagellar basal-body rod protein FlgC|nr:flagellar basal body rod protein FlgC [bacterium]